MGYSEYILLGVCHGTQKRGVLPKKGVLGVGTAQKRGVLGAGTTKKGGIRCVYSPKKGEFRNGFVKRVLGAYLFIIFTFTCQHDQLVGVCSGRLKRNVPVLGAGTARKRGS